VANLIDGIYRISFSPITHQIKQRISISENLQPHSWRSSIEHMNHDDVKDMCKALSLGWGRDHLNNNPYFLLASLTEWIIIEHIFMFYSPSPYMSHYKPYIYGFFFMVIITCHITILSSFTITCQIYHFWLRKRYIVIKITLKTRNCYILVFFIMANR
jgi:hypothetical protein